MMDVLANEAKRDPVEFRLSMLKEHPRHTAVLKLAAEKGGWGEKLPEGRGRGIAVHESFRSFVAMVADVTTKEGAIKVDRVPWSATGCMTYRAETGNVGSSRTAGNRISGDRTGWLGM
jgi:CO/xanthine dehydrogenase Mo-binding subunit